MSTLEVTENNQTAEFNVTEQTVDISQVIQTLEISQTDTALELNETSQTLEILSPATNSLELVNQAAELTIIPDAFILNQSFTSGNEALEVTAGEALGGHRAVYVANGQAFLADNADNTIAGQVIGLTTAASSAGAPATIRFAGTLDESGWEFTPGPVYVGPSGTLTQTRPATGWVLNIGVAVTPTRLLIHKTMSIEVV